MKIIDTNSVNHIFRNGITVQDVYYIAPDVKEESEITELLFRKPLPANIKEIAREKIFDSVAYLKNYRYLLNKYGSLYFYNLGDIGDISMLATIKTLGDTFDAQDRRLFSELDQSLSVITEDDGVIKKINKEFNVATNNWKVTLLRNSAIV